MTWWPSLMIWVFWGQWKISMFLRTSLTLSRPWWDLRRYSRRWGWCPDWRGWTWVETGSADFIMRICSQGVFLPCKSWILGIILWRMRGTWCTRRIWRICWCWRLLGIHLRWRLRCCMRIWSDLWLVNCQRLWSIELISARKLNGKFKRTRSHWL